MSSTVWSTVIVGGGAAGLFTAAQLYSATPVLLLEKGGACGNKLLLSGGGRCNITQDAGAQALLAHYADHPRFLLSALHRYGPDVLRHFLQAIAVPTVLEAGGRVFPKSQSAKDVRDALVRTVQKRGVEIRYRSNVIGIEKLSGGRGRWLLTLDDRSQIHAHSLVLASGGASYPATGSSGEILSYLQEAGIKTRPWQAALTDLQWLDGPPVDFKSLAGLSLDDVALSFSNAKGKATARGDLLFTHRGISGPAALNLSRAVPEEGAAVALNFLPNESEESLLESLRSSQATYARSGMAAFLSQWLPQRLAQVCLERYWEQSKKLTVADLPIATMRRIAGDLLNLTLPHLRKGRLKQGMVSQGGVDIKEINPKTMELKSYPGLYICGELIDLVGDSGGYNLQLAFSTAGAVAEALSS